MNKPRTVRLGLLWKIILFLTVTLVPLAAITWWISVRALTTNLTDEFTSKGSAIARSLASSGVDLLLTRATAQHIRELIVGGRTVVKDGAMTGVDFPKARAEVLAQMRAGMAASDSLARAMPALDRAMAAHFEPDCPCC